MEALINVTYNASVKFDGPINTSQKLPDNMRSGHIRYNLDEFQSKGRPLAYYLVIMAIDWLTGLILQHKYGFTWVRSTNGNDSNSYYYRPAVNSGSDTKKEEEAIVFVHGLGVGLFPYMAFLISLITKNTHRPIVLLEQRHFASQLFHSKVPTRLDTLRVIDDIFSTRLVSPTTGTPLKAHWIGHSMGTITVGWVAKYRTDYVSHTSLIDPVVFQMWKADLTYNFLYKIPTTGVALLLWYCAAQEVYTAHAIRRHFVWYENIMFPEQLPRKKSMGDVEEGEEIVAAHVYLSEKDKIIDAPAAFEYLQRGARVPQRWKFVHNGDEIECHEGDEFHVERAVSTKDAIRARMWKRTLHAGFLFNPRLYNEVVSNI
jgi:pimeloyl-ACP methyl ester carboxylesterase